MNNSHESFYLAEYRHLKEILQNVDKAHPLFQHQQLHTLYYEKKTYPIDLIKLGHDDPSLPLIIFIGGVHGIERIGTQVVLTFLNNLLQRLSWDQHINHVLDSCRIHILPLANPIGLKNNSRCNGNGIDLMRNAPIQAEERVNFMVGGQRLSRYLPWYRGHEGEVEIETALLLKLANQPSPFTLLLDVHSGFGAQDQIWFPLASSTKPIPHLPELFRIYQLLQNNYPHNNYRFEPQSLHYLTHGDIWDCAYKQAQQTQLRLLPLTLELGSWRWLRKSPFSFNRDAVFNPMKPHRVQRVLRHHLSLMEFLIRICGSHANWWPENDQRQDLQESALKHWYT